jgi:hypothetical protein
MDLNANGDVAAWSISGPKPLLVGYVARLRRMYEGGKTFYDFGANALNAKPTAYFEGNEP